MQAFTAQTVVEAKIIDLIEMKTASKRILVIICLTIINNEISMNPNT